MFSQLAVWAVLYWYDSRVDYQLGFGDRAIIIEIHQAIHRIVFDLDASTRAPLLQRLDNVVIINVTFIYLPQSTIRLQTLCAKLTTWILLTETSP
jgi:hypothetical protein